MRPRVSAASSECLREVLEACAHLPLGDDLGTLRDYVTETARRVFRVPMAGILAREHEGYLLESLGPESLGDDGPILGNLELVSCARSCAVQAIHQQKLMEFRFSPSRSEDDDYHGLVQPLQDGASSTALLMARKDHFSPAEISAFQVLGNIARLALDNVELSGAGSEQHRKRAENLMEMALELGSALRLPEFVSNFTSRVAGMMQAECAILALAQGNKLESVGFFGLKPERHLQRKLNAALSEYAEKYPDSKINSDGTDALGKSLTDGFRWQSLTLVRLEGAEGDLLGMLCLANIGKELLPNDLHLLKALIGHASVALENSRLFTRITQSSRQWAEIFDSISDYIVVHDEQCRILRVNRSLAEFIGVRPAELIGLGMRALLSITTESESIQPCPFCRSERDSDEYLHPVLERSYLVSTSRVHGALNEGLQTVHVLKDITDRREAERRYRELFDNVQEGVFFSSAEGRFIEVNDALVRMLGYQTRDELLRLVWELEFDPGSNVVDVYVAALRRKLGSTVIETVRGRGYRLRVGALDVAASA